MDSISKRMINLRTSLNLSQMKLSKALGVSQAAINRYEHNLVAVPHNVLLKYADFFDVSADYILGRTDKPEGAVSITSQRYSKKEYSKRTNGWIS